MTNPFDFFEGVYCTNLDHRVDRWATVQKEFSSVGILDRVKRFSSIKEEDGRLGIIKSKLEIIKIAQQRGLNNILILEDDVKFISSNPLEILDEALCQMKEREWYLCYLGANLHHPLNRPSPNLLHAKDAYGLHAVGYNKNVYQFFIDKYSEFNKVEKWEDILDVFMAIEIQDKFPCFLVNPMIATQSSDYSDIEKRVVDQSYIESRFNQYIG